MKYEKFIVANLDLFEQIGRNKTHFAQLLKESYPKELGSTNLEGIRAGVKAFFRDNPLPNIEQPVDKIKDISIVIQEDRKNKALMAQLNDVKKKNEYLLAKLESTEQAYDDLLAIKEKSDTLEIKFEKSSGSKNMGTPIISLSDWHIEENVRRGQVNGFNEYNLKIAEKRSMAVFQNMVKLIDKESKDVHIKDVVVWLGGDFISGYIHDELVESNNLSPLQAIRMAKQLIMNGFEFLLKNTKVNFIIPCSVGNHGRNTKKMHISTSSATNYEYMMYSDLKDLFRNEKRMTFHMPESDDCYVKVLGKTIRFFHGEAVKYGGGIGGLTIPLIKYLLRKDEQRKADFTCLGHFHQLFYPTTSCCVNGSLIGLSPYGHKAGFKPEKPAQAFTLLDEKRGISVKIPIFAE